MTFLLMFILFDFLLLYLLTLCFFFEFYYHYFTSYDFIDIGILHSTSFFLPPLFPVLHPPLSHDFFPFYYNRIVLHRLSEI